MNHEITDNVKDFVISLKFSSDEKFLAGATSKGTIIVWSPESPVHRVGEFDCSPMYCGGIDFHPKDQLLAVAALGTLQIYQIPDGKLINEFPGVEGEELHTVSFSPSGRSLLTAGDDEMIRILSVETGATQFELPAGERNSSITFHPSGDVFAATCSWQGGSEVRFFQFSETTKIIRQLDDLTIKRPFDALGPCAFDPSGSCFSFSDQNVNVYEFPSCKFSHGFDLEGKQITHPANGFLVKKHWSNLVFSSDGRYLICGAPDGHVFAWSMDEYRTTTSLARHEHAVLAVAHSSGRGLLASSGYDKTIRIFKSAPR